MYINEYTMDRKMIAEYVIKILCKRLIVLGILLCVLILITFWSSTVSVFQIGICGVIVAFILFCIILMINNFERTAKRLNNGNIEKTVVEFNDHIIMNEGKVHLEFEYSQIISIKQTKSFIVLSLGEGSAILVHKDGFIKGNREDFIDFIKDKMSDKEE